MHIIAHISDGFLAQIFRRGNPKVEGVTLEDWLRVAFPEAASLALYSHP